MMNVRIKRWPLEVTGVAENGAHVESSVGGHVLHTDEPASRGGTDAGPAPLATFVASLVGCTQATLNLISGERGVVFEDVSYRLSTEVDPRGAFGVAEVKRPVKEIRVDVECSTDATEEQLEEIREELPRRCMVSTVLRQAGVEIRHSWHAKPLS